MFFLTYIVVSLQGCGNGRNDSSDNWNDNSSSNSGSNINFKTDEVYYIGAYNTYTVDGGYWRKSSKIYVYKRSSGTYYAKFDKDDHNSYTVFDAPYNCPYKNYITNEWGYTYYFTL